MRRHKQAKIVATLGPASSDLDTIRALFDEGADVFRLNFSHGAHADHQRRLQCVREIEAATGRPVGIIADLQGPKLRIGTFAEGPVMLTAGQAFRLCLEPGTRGDATQVALPHPEIFAALQAGTELLIDDGRVRLRVDEVHETVACATVLSGGVISDRKGVNVPGVVLPLSAITDKDRRDLEFALSQGVDWVALSFVQRPEDIAEVKALVGERAGIIAKLEKPSAIDLLDAIVSETDAVMVARGDLGVELPAEQVPAIQKRIIRACRRAGKPVIVATQMLESMVHAPVPTRAEASDVATAIYDGADAVMLSAESASGEHPIQAVTIMRRIIEHTERDHSYRIAIQASRAEPRPTVADAIGVALRDISDLLRATANVAYTSSGYSALRMARERPAAPIIGMTPRRATARRLALAWGVHAVLCHEIADVAEMTELATLTTRREGFGEPGQFIVISAGMPFNLPGTTNLLHVAQL